MAHNLIESRNHILMNTPHLATTTGTMVTFNTDLAAPLTSVKANFLPVQEGSGDPSPTNVRPITGWTGIKVCRAGKNLLDPAVKSGPSYVLDECSLPLFCPFPEIRADLCQLRPFPSRPNR